MKRTMGLVDLCHVYFGLFGAFQLARLDASLHPYIDRCPQDSCENDAQRMPCCNHRRWRKSSG